MSTPLPELVERCLAEHREKKIQALVDALQNIADAGPEREPKPQRGADHDVLLAWEDGHANACWDLAKKARDALADWEAA
jgi:hypothetical protein